MKNLFINCVYFTQLHFAFQDAKNLYMVMDYMAGKYHYNTGLHKSRFCIENSTDL